MVVFLVTLGFCSLVRLSVTWLERSMASSLLTPSQADLGKWAVSVLLSALVAGLWKRGWWESIDGE